MRMVLSLLCPNMFIDWNFFSGEPCGLLFIWSIWFDLMFDVIVCCLTQIQYNPLCAGSCSFDQYDLMPCAVLLRFTTTCCVLHLVLMIRMIWCHVLSDSDSLWHAVCCILFIIIMIWCHCVLSDLDSLWCAVCCRHVLPRAAQPGPGGRQLCRWPFTGAPGPQHTQTSEAGH